MAGRRVKILFLLSSLEPAGSETYCVSLANAWQGRHEIFWISDALHFGQANHALPISRKAVPGGLFNALKVASFIRKHKIDIVHSHSRRAHWVAAQAANLTGVPHVTTMHQPLPVHFFSRLFPCLGDATIAIDESVADHVIKRFDAPSQRVHLIRNGIPLKDFSPSLRETPGQKKILVIGRLTGGRWDAFQFFLKTLAAAGLPPALYQIVGRVPQERQSALTNQLSILNSRIAPARVELLGFVNDLAITVRNADGVVAAGRSAMEALANARPVVILGEGGTLGLCDASSWTAALKSNFGDHLAPKQFDAAKLKAGLMEILSPHGSQAELIRWGREQMEKYYDVAKIAAQVERVYANVAAGGRS